MSIAWLEIDMAAKAEASDLVKEGWELSQAAGKRMSGKDIEDYIRRCEVIREKYQRDGKAIASMAPNEGYGE